MSLVDAGPPELVLDAYGLSGTPAMLAGGEGKAWAIESMVLKPAEVPGLAQWSGEVLSGVERRGFRLAIPVRTRTGGWEAAGWTATCLLPGEAPDHAHAPRWADVLAAGRAFHRAVADLAAPAFVGGGTSWWARADRVAWSEEECRFGPGLEPLVARLRPALTELGPPSLVDCDLTGNVLFADGFEPAVIDLSLYWRPAAYAEGVVVADALTWHPETAPLPEELGVPIAAVARGLLFRMATTQFRADDGVETAKLENEASRYASAVRALGL